MLDPLLTGADQAMVNAFTGGFRVAQIKTAISKALLEPAAAAALESAQIVALAILVREQLYPIQFASIYRPFATVLPGPGYEAPPAVDRQIAAFLQRLPSLTGEAEAEAAAVAKVLGEPPKAAPAAGNSSSGEAMPGEMQGPDTTKGNQPAKTTPPAELLESINTPKVWPLLLSTSVDVVAALLTWLPMLDMPCSARLTRLTDALTPPSSRRRSKDWPRRSQWRSPRARRPDRR